VARKHRNEETENHDKGPYRARNKGLLLLLVLG
jgi:hypothetical protein